MQNHVQGTRLYGRKGQKLGMNHNDLDRTNVLSRYEKKTATDRNFDNTQELPPLPSDASPAFPKKGTVRELSPLSTETTKRIENPARVGSRWRKKGRWILTIVVCFALALFCGFWLSGMFRDHERALKDSRKEAQQIETRQQELAAREDSLKKQRTSIAEQKRALEEREMELERKVQRAAGRTERIAQEKSHGSTVDSWMDKVTGKEKERKEANEKNAAEIQQANLDIASVQQSIKEAQAILDEVDNQIDNVNEMKRQADRLKTAAEDTYAKNEGTINNILQHLNEGVDLLRNSLR